MENTRYINMLDLSPQQRELTGLPFGLYAEDNSFLEKLYNYVWKFHKTEDKGEILHVLQLRYELMSQNRYQLARLYERPIEEIRVLNQLTPLMESENGLRFQLLSSSIAVDISDSTARYTQSGQVFIVGEDNHSWIRTALRVEQLEESKELTAEPLPVQPPSLPELKPSMQSGAYSG